jgi:LEA14-like dessication related protein
VKETLIVSPVSAASGQRPGVSGHNSAPCSAHPYLRSVYPQGRGDHQRFLKGMIGNTWTPLTGLLTVVVCVLLASCASLGGYREKPRVSLIGIQPLGMTLLEQRYLLALRILNPNDVEIPISGMSYSVEINDREFAYGVSRQAVTIPALGEAVVEVEVVSSLLDMLRQLQSLDDARQSRLDYRISGGLSLANRRAKLPFDYSGTLDWKPAADKPPTGT